MTTKTLSTYDANRQFGEIYSNYTGECIWAGHAVFEASFRDIERAIRRAERRGYRAGVNHVRSMVPEIDC